MFDKLKTGCAIVVGATGGLGAAICEALGSNGSAVVAGYRSNTKAADKLKVKLAGLGIAVECVQIDLLDVVSLTRMLETAKARFGSIHTLVVASGPTVTFSPVARTSSEDWARALSVDAQGFFNAASLTIPYLRESRGSIVALSTSATARYPSLDILSAGPKAAVEMVSRAIAREEGRNGVRSNVIRVGQINAGQGLSMLEGEKGKKIQERALAATPLRRLGEAEDISNAVLFFASDMASFVTGETLCVDGGVNI